jgi:outer membrane protein TolC
LAVRQAYYNVTSAAAQIDSANTALQEAIVARRLAQTRYEGQVGLYLEVTDSQAALVAAQNNQVNAVYDYLIARAQLEYEIGGGKH